MVHFFSVYPDLNRINSVAEKFNQRVLMGMKLWALCFKIHINLSEKLENTKEEYLVEFQTHKTVISNFISVHFYLTGISQLCNKSQRLQYLQLSPFCHKSLASLSTS